MKKISSPNTYRTVSLMFLWLSATVSYAQNVGINPTGAAGHASAMLDVSATDKGMLIPRIVLTDVASATPVASPVAGLLVYNTNASVTGGYGTGFYYWSGSAWTKMATGNPMASTMADGKIWVGNTSGLATERTLAGDATMNNAGILDLSNLAVETSELNDLAVTTPKLADNSVDGSKISLAANATGDLMYYNGTDWVRLASGSSGQLLRTNGAAAPAWANGNDLFTFENGLTETAPSTVRLGGVLMQNTAIAQGGYTLAYTGTTTNAFSVDGSTFSVDAANDRVGIGTANPGRKLEVNGDLLLRNSAGIKAIYTWDAGDENWRIGMNENPGFARAMATSHVQYIAYSGGANQGFAVGANGGNSSFEITGNNHNAFFRGNVGIGSTAPAVPLAVGGNGSNVYSTSIWTENNVHVQGNESLTQGGRGRLRVGTAWGYVGLYAETSSTGINNDLILGSASGTVRIGPAAGAQRLRVSSLEGTGNRLVYADANGQLNTGMQILYGSINSDGYINNHGTTCTTCGFSVSSISTGIKRITFTTPFSGIPTVSVTQHFPNNGGNGFGNTGSGGSTMDNALTVAVTSTYVDIKTGDGSGNPANRSFGFIIIGPR